MITKNVTTGKRYKVLAAGLMAAWLSTVALASGQDGQAVNDVELQIASGPTPSSIDPQAYALYKKANDMQTHSIENFPSVGVFVNRGHDVPESEEQIVELIHWLLQNEKIPNARVVSGQGRGETTLFTIFVNGSPETWTFSNIERGIKTAKNDLDDATKAKNFEVTQGLAFGQ